MRDRMIHNKISAHTSESYLEDVNSLHPFSFSPSLSLSFCTGILIHTPFFFFFAERWSGPNNPTPTVDWCLIRRTWSTWNRMYMVYDISQKGTNTRSSLFHKDRLVFSSWGSTGWLRSGSLPLLYYCIYR
jgi:hypothetical protein